MKRTARIRIPPQQHGLSLLDALISRFTYHDADEWLALIEQGRLLIDGEPGTPQRVLIAGQELEYRVPSIPEPDVATEYDVIFEDDHILVVNKPANLPCHPAGRFFNNTLWAMLRENHGLPKVHFVNRLDRETSGIVLVGKSARAARHCRRQFEQRSVRKRYIVLVEGRFPDSLEAGGWLERAAGSAVAKKQRFVSRSEDPAAEGNKRVAAVTSLRRILSHAGLSLVEALPETGRFHQIRATLCSLGFPVVGDKLYGVDDTMYLRFIEGNLTPHDQALLRLPRQALHAASLAFSHPVTVAPAHFQAPLPEDMAALLPGDTHD